VNLLIKVFYNALVRNYYTLKSTVLWICSFNTLPSVFFHILPCYGTDFIALFFRVIVTITVWPYNLVFTCFPLLHYCVTMCWFVWEYT